MQNTLILPDPAVAGNSFGFTSIRLSELISALSYALDITEGQPRGHAVRTCVIGMRLGQAIGLPPAMQEDLYYALLLKDAGCSSNASRLFNILGTDEIRAKRDVKTMDWTRVGFDSLQYALSHIRTGRPFLERVRALLDSAVNRKKQSREIVTIRCERGAAIARKIGLSDASAAGIQQLDEHWDGGGYPDGRRGEEISLLARIINLAQTLDVFRTEKGHRAAIDVAHARRGRWFDPALVRAAAALAKQGSLWLDLDGTEANARAIAMEPSHRVIFADSARVDDICCAFADVVDAKSPFTYRHSNGVAAAAVKISELMGFSPGDVTVIRRAALLHDIGKLSVPNSILEKPGKLDDDEWQVVRKHPYYTQQILQQIPGFHELTEIASSHHEKLDGTGYFRNLRAEDLSTPSRILAVADIYDALAADRPYREGLPLDTVFKIMRKDTPHALDPDCMEALRLAHAA